MEVILDYMGNKFLIALLFIFFALLFIPKIIDADIISKNSGGGINFMIDSGANIEGFFRVS